jgi:hypothetical protein
MMIWPGAGLADEDVAVGVAREHLTREIAFIAMMADCAYALALRRTSRRPTY